MSITNNGYMSFSGIAPPEGSDRIDLTPANIFNNQNWNNPTQRDLIFVIYGTSPKTVHIAPSGTFDVGLLQLIGGNTSFSLGSPGSILTNVEDILVQGNNMESVNIQNGDSVGFTNLILDKPIPENLTHYNITDLDL
ncbi:hypothetical protein MOUN0_F03312 [Monosporozyma unispora]|nr:hypothetical protein C6P44_002453 [Kazachstania unispora]